MPWIPLKYVAADSQPGRNRWPWELLLLPHEVNKCTHGCFSERLFWPPLSSSASITFFSRAALAPVVDGIGIADP